MQQGSVGARDGDSTRSPKNTNSIDPEGRIRVKVEAPESSDVFEVKREPQEAYHAAHHDCPYDRKSIAPPPKLDGNTEIVGQYQSQHQGYPRSVAGALPNSYGFPHFYGPPAMLPPSFPGARPPTDRSIGKIDEHDHEQERYRVPVTGVASDSAFLHHDHHRFEIGDYHGKGYHGMPYAAFRPSLPQRPSAYAGHQNNNSYRAAQYQNRKRKWSGAALRGMHPSIPVSFRLD